MSSSPDSDAGPSSSDEEGMQHFPVTPGLGLSLEGKDEEGDEEIMDRCKTRVQGERV